MDVIQNMAQPPSAESIQASISGEISGQVAVGSYILQIGSVHGGVVNINLPEQKPRLKARPTPVYILPRRFAGLLDRVDEVGAAAGALPDTRPVEFHAGSGAGKTSLLRFLARHSLATDFPDGVIYLRVKGQAPSDLLQSLFDAFFEYDSPYKPSDGEIRLALQDKRALILLDDVDLDREEVEALFDAAPESAFLLASDNQRLWGEGLSIALPGLPLQEARRFLERELGRPLDRQESAAADDLCKALDGHPLALLQATALVREHGYSLESLAAMAEQSEGLLGDRQPKKKIAALAFSLLTGPQSLAVAAISAMDGAPMNARHLPALTGLPEVEPVMVGLLKRGVVQESDSGFRLAASISRLVSENWDLGRWQDTLLSYFRSWAAEKMENPQQILEEAEGLLRLIESALKAGRWEDSLELVQRIDSALAMSRHWEAWEQALLHALQAAEALGDLKAKAWVLHQMGTRLLSLNETQAARSLLVQALRMREMLGDWEGAAVTRHNLNLILGPPGGDGKNSPNGRPPSGPSRYRLMAGGITALLASGLFLAVAAVAWSAVQFYKFQPPAIPLPVTPTPTQPGVFPPMATLPVLIPDTGSRTAPEPSPAATETATPTAEIPLPPPTETATTVVESPLPPATDTHPPPSCAPRQDWPALVVRRGDTLWSLAQATGSSVAELRQANCLPGTRIIAGQTLFVPRLPSSPPTFTPTQTPTLTPTYTPTPTDTPTTPPPLPPDLVISSLQVGPAVPDNKRLQYGFFKAPVSVTVANQGEQAAGPPFNVAVYFGWAGSVPEAGGRPAPPMVFTVESPLGPGASLTFNGTLAFFYDGGIPSFETWAVADDCSPTPAPDTCRVIEGNEANNQTGPQRVEVINTPPSAAITSPDGDLTLAPDGYGEGGWYKDLVLIGSAQDPEQGPLDGDSLTWTSDLAGNLGSGSQLPARLYSNRCTGQTHIVTLTASDSQNAQATDTRRITIKNEVCRPTIKVGQPQSQTVYRQDLLYNDAEKVYTLNMDGRAEAYDIHGVSLTAALAWSVDGSEVGTGGNPAFKLILPDTEEPCDAVTHTVGVTVTDEEGNRAEVGIPITLKECEPEG